MKLLLEKIERLLMASVMAEAGAPEMARAYLVDEGTQSKEGLQEFLANVGLQDVRIYYGVARV
jgi:hypothetical protein